MMVVSQGKLWVTAAWYDGGVKGKAGGDRSMVLWCHEENWRSQEHSMMVVS